MSHGQNTKTQNRINIAINPIKTLKNDPHPPKILEKNENWLKKESGF